MLHTYFWLVGIAIRIEDCLNYILLLLILVAFADSRQNFYFSTLDAKSDVEILS